MFGICVTPMKNYEYNYRNLLSFILKCIFKLFMKGVRLRVARLYKTGIRQTALALEHPTEPME